MDQQVLGQVRNLENELRQTANSSLEKYRKLFGDSDDDTPPSQRPTPPRPDPNPMSQPQIRSNNQTIYTNADPATRAKKFDSPMEAPQIRSRDGIKYSSPRHSNLDDLETSDDESSSSSEETPDLSKAQFLPKTKQKLMMKAKARTPMNTDTGDSSTLEGTQHPSKRLATFIRKNHSPIQPLYPLRANQLFEYKSPRTGFGNPANGKSGSTGFNSPKPSPTFVKVENEDLELDKIDRHNPLEDERGRIRPFIHPPSQRSKPTGKFAPLASIKEEEEDRFENESVDHSALQIQTKTNVRSGQHNTHNENLDLSNLSSSFNMSNLVHSNIPDFKISSSTLKQPIPSSHEFPKQDFTSFKDIPGVRQLFVYTIILIDYY